MWECKRRRGPRRSVLLYGLRRQKGQLERDSHFRERPGPPTDGRGLRGRGRYHAGASAGLVATAAAIAMRSVERLHHVERLTQRGNHALLVVDDDGLNALKAAG